MTTGHQPGSGKIPKTRVQLVRELRGLTQEQMARATGMSLASWRRFEAGERQVSLEDWVNTAWMLGCEFEDLVGAERLRTWTPTEAYPETPLTMADDLWAEPVLDYEDVLKALAAFEDSSSN